MMSQKFCNNRGGAQCANCAPYASCGRSSRGRGGFLLADALIAIALASMAIVLASSSISEVRGSFERARERKFAVRAYEAVAGSIPELSPGEAHEIETVFEGRPVKVAAKAYMYGNDAVEMEVEVGEVGAETGAAGTSARRRPVTFRKVFVPSSSAIFDISKYAGPSLCSVDFSQNSAQLEASQILLPVDHSLKLTDIEVRGDILYTSADTSVASDPDLVISDISDRSLPVFISSISTGPGIKAIALAGQRVYAAAASGVAQLHIIRLDGLDSPVLEGKLQLVPPYATATEPYGSAIFYDDGKVFLGTEKWDGPEFTILDVSEPSSPPVPLGSFEVDSIVTHIFVRGGIAYVSTAGAGQLMVIDVSDPADPVLLESFNPSGFERQEGKVTDVFEDRQAFGRTGGGYDIRNDHELFYRRGGTGGAWGSDNIPGGVYGLLSDRYKLFAAAREYDREFQVFGLVFGPDGDDGGLVTLTKVAVSLPIAPEQLTCFGERMYVLGHESPFMYEMGYVLP